MIFLLITIALFLCMIAYFKLADHYNIVDRPNERSSHNTLTVRGGGIIFPLAAILYSFSKGLNYPYFAAGLFLISLISFWDDLKTSSRMLRLLIHLIAVSLLFIETGVFHETVWLIIVSYIIVIGIINAYNFMDGINGITGVYSLSVIITLVWINTLEHFIEQQLLLITIPALIVFLFYNFRKKARCFAGDVGSVSMAFIIVFALTMLLVHTHQFLYLLFLSVYGVDSILTIVFRLMKKENIFDNKT